MKKLAPLVAALALALALPAGAVPTDLVHQGRLLDASGAPLDGAHDLTLALYDAPSGGSALWSETRSVDFDNGFFAVVLGESTPIDASTFDDDALFLGLAVGSGAELPIRITLASVPFAIRAGTADSVDGGTIDASEVSVGGVTVIDADGKIAWSSIKDAPEGSNPLAELGCASGQVPQLTGSTWGCVDADGHQHEATDIASGTLALARLPVGSGADEVAPGNHTHSAADVGALPVGGGTLTGSLDGLDAHFSGVVQVGSGTTCDTDAAGSIRWTGAEFEGCDGTSWTSLGRADGELPGLVVHYDAADDDSYSGSGNKWNDLAGSGVDATLGSCATYGTLGGQETMILPGSDCGYARFNNAKLDAQQFTAVMWVYSQLPNANTDQGGLYVNTDSTTANQANWVWFGKYATDIWYFRVLEGSCCQDLTGSGSKSWEASVPQNQWKMIHFAYQVGGDWKWGVDGENVSVGTLPWHADAQTGRTSTIGYGHGGSGSYWKGGVSSARFYDRLLTDDELAAEFERLRGDYGR